MMSKTIEPQLQSCLRRALRYADLLPEKQSAALLSAIRTDLTEALKQLDAMEQKSSVEG